MKLVVIKSMTCPSCFIMMDIIEKIKQTKDLDIEIYDYDFDKTIASAFMPGSVLPVIIFLDENDNELERLIGEHDYEELLSLINKYE